MKNDDILISIIVPTYNRAALIDKTIHSLLNQTKDNFEIIIVDDGSTDNTKHIIDLFTDSRISYFYKENSERGATRNYGVQKAKGSYINFFDSDDIAYGNHTQEAERMILEANPEIFHLSYDIKTPEGKKSRRISPIKNINNQLINGNPLSCNGVFIRKDIALKNPFNETRELSASEDYLLWLELGAQFNFINSNKVTSTIIDHDERSVVNVNLNSLIKRKLLMLELCYSSLHIQDFYNSKMNSLESNTFSYLALHLALLGEKKEARSYLKKAFQSKRSIILSRRFYAIIKHLIL
jgi:glycosyltransferase involved in cell wall biosynthesis